MSAGRTKSKEEQDYGTYVPMVHSLCRVYENEEYNHKLRNLCQNLRIFKYII